MYKQLNYTSINTFFLMWLVGFPKISLVRLVLESHCGITCWTHLKKLVMCICVPHHLSWTCHNTITYLYEHVVPLVIHMLIFISMGDQLWFVGWGWARGDDWTSVLSILWLWCYNVNHQASNHRENRIE